MLMAAARVNLPSVFVYGGSILPGQLADGTAVTIQDVFEAVGAHALHDIDSADVVLTASDERSIALLVHHARRAAQFRPLLC